MQANLSTASSCPTLLVLGSGCEAGYYGDSRMFPGEPGHTQPGLWHREGKGYFLSSKVCQVLHHSVKVISNLV